MKRDTNFTLNKVPKLNSVVGILGHLTSAHSAEMSAALDGMIEQSLIQTPVKAMTEQDVAMGPFLLHMASLSDKIRIALLQAICPK